MSPLSFWLLWYLKLLNTPENFLIYRLLFHCHPNPLFRIIPWIILLGFNPMSKIRPAKLILWEKIFYTGFHLTGTSISFSSISTYISKRIWNWNSIESSYIYNLKSHVRRFVPGAEFESELNQLLICKLISSKLRTRIFCLRAWFQSWKLFWILSL